MIHPVSYTHLFFLIITTSSSTLENTFVWPLDGYTYISSYFGYRTSPTSGASTYHSGIDIPAPEETTILAVCTGTVTFASWGAGGGYTIVEMCIRDRDSSQPAIRACLSFNFSLV